MNFWLFLVDYWGILMKSRYEGFSWIILGSIDQERFRKVDEYSWVPSKRDSFWTFSRIFENPKKKLNQIKKWYYYSLGLFMVYSELINLNQPNYASISGNNQFQNIVLSPNSRIIIIIISTDPIFSSTCPHR